MGELLLTIRPPKLDVLNTAVLTQTCDALSSSVGASEIRIVVLTGDGRSKQ